MRTRRELCDGYEAGLFDDTIPFWIRHAVDTEHGGYFCGIDHDGTVVDTDKGMWQHGRFVWMLSVLHSTAGANAQWLELARHGIEFIERHGFDQAGRMFFHVTRDGEPLRQRRYWFTEAFTACAFAAYGHAARDTVRAARGEQLFDAMLEGFTRPAATTPKFVPGTRPAKAFAAPMILLWSAQCLRDAMPSSHRAKYVAVIDRAIESIRRDFMKPEHRAVLEQVGEDGAVLDHFDGRLLNPGHAIEAAWFILHEARLRGDDPDLVATGLTILDWMWRRGWDTEHGGILYFRDIFGKPVQEYWHDMKFWWPQAEAIIATLLAHEITADPKYAEWHDRVDRWAHAHFADPVHGEWFGWLHRDGTRSSTLKGSLWKGPFHLPRMQWYCRGLLLDRVPE